jgi:hypothetical protein
MRDGHQRVEFHHGRCALDRVHDPEDLSHILCGKGIRLLRRHHDTFKLVQQAVCFVDIGVQDFVSAAHNKHRLFILIFLMISAGICKN